VEKRIVKKVKKVKSLPHAEPRRKTRRHSTDEVSGRLSHTVGFCIERQQEGQGMLLPRFVTILVASAGLTAVVAIAQTTTSSSTTMQTTSFPPVGLASSETAQINVTNLATASSSGTAASCTGTISFLNASGTAIGSATSYTAAGGVTASVTLPFGKTASTAVRTEIRGVIALTRVSKVPCSLSTSFETYDTTSGVTHVYLSTGDVGGSITLPGR